MFKRTGWGSLQKSWLSKIQCIVSAPPTEKRTKQPVSLICEGLASRLNLPYYDILQKSKTDRPIKEIEDYEERMERLKKSIKINKLQHMGRNNILLIDDVFDSGATLRSCIEVLWEQGCAAAVFALVLTRTQRNWIS